MNQFSIAAGILFEHTEGNPNEPKVIGEVERVFYNGEMVALDVGQTWEVFHLRTRDLIVK